jgi:GntR family transcriptional regulator/MocR family aminotransferase
VDRVLDIAFRPDRRSEAPLPRQLADHLATMIEAGRLPPGAKLPATREVAAATRLARKTVAAAYDVLAERGLVTAHVGQGTFVAAVRAARATGAAPPAPRTFAWQGLFARGAAIPLPAGLRREARDGRPFDFRGGRVDPASLPLNDLRWAFARPFESRARLRELAVHHDPFGWPPLRREIARHLTARGVACDPEQVLVVSGLQQAIDLAARVLVEPGDAVAIEQPGYFGAALAFGGRGADLLGIEVDEEGLDTEHLARILRVRRVKLAYVTPATQCPTGVTMSERRREGLRALADEHQMPIFEDDYDCELRWAGPALPALAAHDAAGQVIYAGTFSKVLFPSLRLGYVVAARPLLERLAATRLVADFGTGVVAQAALTTLIATRGLERHVRRLRRRYAERLQALLDALAREMPAGTRWITPRGGLLVWVTLPPGVDAERLRRAAADRGVVYTPGDLFHLGGGGAHSLALSFAGLEPDAIREGVTRLGEAARELVVARTTVPRARGRERARERHAVG